MGWVRNGGWRDRVGWVVWAGRWRFIDSSYPPILQSFSAWSLSSRAWTRFIHKELPPCVSNSTPTPTPQGVFCQQDREFGLRDQGHPSVEMDGHRSPGLVLAVSRPCGAALCGKTRFVDKESRIGGSAGVANHTTPSDCAVDLMDTAPAPPPPPPHAPLPRQFLQPRPLPLQPPPPRRHNHQTSRVRQMTRGRRVYGCPTTCAATRTTGVRQRHRSPRPRLRRIRRRSRRQIRQRNRRHSRRRTRQRSRRRRPWSRHHPPRRAPKETWQSARDHEVHIRR